MTPIRDDFEKQGVHELKIRSMFPDAFVWHGSTPVFDRPLYILAFTNRTGSNLLADYLRQTGHFRGLEERLNWDSVKRSLESKRFDSFPDYIYELAGPPGTPGAWGIKASWDQILLLKRANIMSMFPGVRIIHSVRHDLLGQAVSHLIAHQTNQWTSEQTSSNVVPEYASDKIEQILMGIVRSNNYIDLIARTLEVPRYTVVYERLQDDPAGEIRRLAEGNYLDVTDWHPRTPKISRQRNEINVNFQSKCMEEWQKAIETAT